MFGQPKSAKYLSHGPVKWKKVFCPVYIIETKLDFVSFKDKNLQKWRKFIGERDFPIQMSYAGQVQ